jgi:FtsZ-binding cell division protein ZapB
MPKEKRKINAWIPVNLYNKLETAGYENITQALIKALERFFEDTEEDTKRSIEDITGYIQDITGYKQNIIEYKQNIEGYLNNIEALTTENKQLKESITGYQKDISRHIHDIEGSRKDTESIQEGYKQDITGYKENIKALNTEITRLKEYLANSPDLSEFSRLQARSEELERHNQTLKEELNKSNQREEDLKQMHNNYFLQVQTLINQKAIGAPGEKKPFWKFW